MKILIAVDDSQPSQDALRFAEKLVPDGCEVRVLNVAHNALEPIPMGGGFVGIMEPAMVYASVNPEEGAAQRARAIVKSAAEQVSAHVDEATTGVVVAEGPVGPTICKVAEDEHVDLIILGTHDRSAWGRLWYGSVSDHVLHHAPCSVLVVR